MRPARPRRRGGSERGAVALLLIAVVVVAASLVVAVGPVGGELVARSRLDAVADVGALAAATGGGAAAASVVQRSGADLVAVRVTADGTAIVEVALEGRRATAAATTVAPAGGVDGPAAGPDEPVGGR